MFFGILSIPSAFFAKPATQWEDDEDYALDSEIISELKICNDSAERGVQLVADFLHSARVEKKKLQKLHADGRREQKKNRQPLKWPLYFQLNFTVCCVVYCPVVQCLYKYSIQHRYCSAVFSQKPTITIVMFLI